ncbi:alpha/beta hydrolase fold domain-containing protein [Alteromonas sp. 345S023]|uniref:Alpha/beta hydrolase fold domain-containing protein n=1 Tax=Alteromonas profundi TaxID=2696062 RepID=A0A7X5LJH5_9ALTE|nr:alpha/beta hydrolase [Alteromonas profundi]NDV90488.1 alpha/beta hydrolase fold domain-containing protein [Alteromonas profundi]
MPKETSENIPLYSRSIPGAREAIDQESIESQDVTGRFVINVSQPQLTAYWPSSKVHNGGAIVICPGGGYRGLSVDLEGHAIAVELVKLGISAFVLKYRTPSTITMDNPKMGPLQDIQQALHIINTQATNWQINAEKIGVMGFSAGGHLASSAAVHYNRPVPRNTVPKLLKPAFQILIYPVISMDPAITHIQSKTLLLGEQVSAADIRYFSNDMQVTEDSPPAFILHANDDSHVPVENSIRYYQALRKSQVPVQLLTLPHGGHGFGMYHQYTWFETLKMWLKLYDFIR